MINRKKIVKQLDVAVSKIVIARDLHCVVCGSTYRLTCGHLFSRTAYSTRWDLGNCFCQCWKCNYSHEFDPYPFTNWYIKKFGQQSLDDLHRKYVTVQKFSNVQLVELLQKLYDENEELLHGTN